MLSIERLFYLLNTRTICAERTQLNAAHVQLLKIIETDSRNLAEK